MSDARKNWIGAHWCSAASEDGFDLAALSDPPRPLGRWPRSGREDVRAALEASQHAAPAWRRASPIERQRFLARAAHELLATADAEDGIRARLGLDAGEFAPFVAGLDDVLERAIRETSTDVAPQARALGVHVPHWSEIVRAPTVRLFTALARGESAILLSDRRLPMAAGAIALALSRAGLPAGVVSLLHDDGATCSRALAAHDEVDAFYGAGPTAEMRALARRIALDGSHDMRPVRARQPALELTVLRNRTEVVARDDDPDASALRVARHAFGRIPALSGQAPDQIGRVLCDERSFSRFTAALLAALASSDDAPRSIPLIDADALRHVVRARALGLDEGATLIHASGVARPTSPAVRPDATLAALVFTNVEPFMRLAASWRPAPCLCLVRTTSDTAASTLRAHLDRRTRTEELSGAGAAESGDLEVDL